MNGILAFKTGLRMSVRKTKERSRIFFRWFVLWECKCLLLVVTEQTILTLKLFHNIIIGYLLISVISGCYVFFLSHIMKTSVLPPAYFLLIAALISLGLSKSFAPIFLTKCVTVPIWRGDETEKTVIALVLCWIGTPAMFFITGFFPQICWNVFCDF